jgi:hypothetical protein
MIFFNDVHIYSGAINSLGIKLSHGILFVINYINVIIKKNNYCLLARLREIMGGDL